MSRPRIASAHGFASIARPIVDITGGAPELSEFFRYFVETARACGAHVIDRNNLTIIEERELRAGCRSISRSTRSRSIASLPCYSAENVNAAARRRRVRQKHLRALKKLNAVGYGTRLPLNLVYNPLGATLPGPQAELEADYKEALQRDFGIVFNRLFTITNQPIARFAEDLRAQGKWDEYLELLVERLQSRDRRRTDVPLHAERRLARRSSSTATSTRCSGCNCAMARRCSCGM